MKVSLSDLPDQAQGVWVTDGKDDVHIYASKTTGVVLGHNVNQCTEDKGSRLALVFSTEGTIKLQVIDPATKELKNFDVPKGLVYEQILQTLNKIKSLVE